MMRITLAFVAALCWPAAVSGPLARADQAAGKAASNATKGRTVTEQAFGKTAEGAAARLFTVANSHGVTMRVTDYGARLVAVDVPDRNGKTANVTLGFDSAEKYAAHTAFFGCTTGRFANRIARGRFTLDGVEYKLATNNGPNHLHGGARGFDRYVWKAEPVATANGSGVQFRMHSPDRDEGYPGGLDVTVTYLLNDKNDVRIDYQATTDKPTVLNLTNHAYWNLAGAGNGDILGHKLTLEADSYLAVDEGMIPTGRLVPVKGTCMSFTEPHEIGARIAETKQGVPPPGGYDHCYVLRGKPGELSPAARVVEPNSGRVMEVFTTEPAVQLYTANFLDGDSKNGGYRQHAAFCLETQHYPDSPNQPAFPSTVLRPGQTYRQTTVYRFLTEAK